MLISVKDQDIPIPPSVMHNVYLFEVSLRRSLLTYEWFSVIAPWLYLDPIWGRIFALGVEETATHLSTRCSPVYSQDEVSHNVTYYPYSRTESEPIAL